MSYLKNTAGQKVNFLAINAATGLPVTGDAANITAKISLDSGAAASVADTNPTELDATNFPGVYVFDLTQGETNADVLTIKSSSSTANVEMDLVNIYTVDPATYKADVSGLATAINLGITDGKCTSILTDTGTTIPAQISALNDFDPVNDAVANVTLCATTTTNTDMRGTDSGALASSLSITNSNVNAIKTKTDQFVFTVANQVDANALTGGTSSSDIYTYFTDGTREDAFKADVSNLATSASIAALNDFDPASDTVANVTLVATTTTNTDMRGTNGANTVAPANSDVAAIKAKTDQFVFTVSNQVDANALTGGGGDDASAIYTYFTDGTREDAFKADVSNLATSASIAALNDLNSTQIENAVWDAAKSSHTSAGTFGSYLDAKVSEAGGGGYTDGPIIGRVISDGTTEATVTQGQVIKGIVLD